MASRHNNECHSGQVNIAMLPFVERHSRMSLNECVLIALIWQYFSQSFIVYIRYKAKISLHCINITKPVRFTDVTCAFLKIDIGIWL